MSENNGWCYLHNGRQWLEGGCDPKEAAKELRLYAAQMGQPEPGAPGVEGKS